MVLAIVALAIVASYGTADSPAQEADTQAESDTRIAEAMSDPIEAHVRINRDQIDAAREDDTERFAADYDEGAATQEALLDAATDAGLPQCAEVDR